MKKVDEVLQKEVKANTDGSGGWGPGDVERLFNQLRKHWEAEQLEAMRSEATVALIARRIEVFTRTRQATEPWIADVEAVNLASMILTDLTTAQAIVEP
jgi:hypothetical protein